MLRNKLDFRAPPPPLLILRSLHMSDGHILNVRHTRKHTLSELLPVKIRMQTNSELTREYFEIMDALGGDIQGSREARLHVRSQVGRTPLRVRQWYRHCCVQRARSVGGDGFDGLFTVLHPPFFKEARGRSHMSRFYSACTRKLFGWEWARSDSPSP